MGRSRPNFSPKLEPIHRTSPIAENGDIVVFGDIAENGDIPPTLLFWGIPRGALEDQRVQHQNSIKTIF